MNGTIESIISAGAERVGIEVKKELFSENILSDRLEYFCVPYVKEISFSPKIRSKDMVSYGVEVDYSVKIRFFGKRGNYSDYEKLEGIIGDFLNYIGTNSACIPLKLERSEISRNSTLFRLESEAFLQLRHLILSDGGGEVSENE